MAVLVERLTGDHLLAFSKDRGLPRDLSQRTNHTLVAVDETVQRIRDADLVTKVLDKLLCAAEIVPRHAGVQVVNRLELQAAMEEVEPLRAFDIHRGAEHPLRERLIRPQITRAHGEVRQADLGMKRHGDHMADHDENKPVPGSGNRLVYKEIAEPDPENHLTAKLEVSMPPGWTLPRGVGA